MSVFEDRLNILLGESGDKTLINATICPCWHYAFAINPLYMWAGRGRLITEDSQVWLGTIDQHGRNHHVTPRLTDARDGSSVESRFTLPYLDQATYETLRDDHEAVYGVIVTCWLALVEEGEGMRPGAPLDFFGQWTLQSTLFEEAVVPDERTFVVERKITAIAMNGNSGRSRRGGGTYTDTCQQERAAYYGEDPDYGCGFVASLANKTLQPP